MRKVGWSALRATGRQGTDTDRPSGSSKEISDVLVRSELRWPPQPQTDLGEQIASDAPGGVAREIVSRVAAAEIHGVLDTTVWPDVLQRHFRSVRLDRLPAFDHCLALHEGGGRIERFGHQLTGRQTRETCLYVQRANVRIDRDHIVMDTLGMGQHGRAQQHE